MEIGKEKGGRDHVLQEYGRVGKGRVCRITLPLNNCPETAGRERRRRRIWAVGR